MEIVSLLKRCEIFIGLADADLENIAKLKSWRRNVYNEGDTVFVESSSAQKFYIVEEGEIRLVLGVYDKGSKEIKQVQAETITKGNIFGWPSIVAPNLFAMSAVSMKHSIALSIEGADLRELMDNNPVIGYEIMKALIWVVANRLRELRLKLLDERK